jgi:hypothetical protein
MLLTRPDLESVVVVKVRASLVACFLFACVAASLGRVACLQHHGPLAWGDELTRPYFVSSDASLSRSSPVLTTFF